MIIFEKISWKNFLSTGNHLTEVNLSSDPTTLIVGSNGAGKSTILDALTFSLYGKSFRKINKAQLINSTNEKDCFVSIQFSINGVDWKVERGIKPNIFKIYKNGEELNQSSSALDQQKWLEQSVLKMNYKSFTQIVILGSSTFVPFMQLPTASRREVVEDLLDIRIFSSMNLLIKDKIRVIKDEIRTLELKKESLNEKVHMQREFIQKIENEAESNIEFKNKKIDKLDDEVASLMKKTEYLDEEVKAQQLVLESYKGSTDKLKEFNTIKGKITQKISNIVKEHKFFSENRVCPTCEQDIEESFRLNRIDDSQNKAEELRKGFEELQDAIKKEELRESNFKQTSGEISNLLNGISKNNTLISTCQKQIRDLEQEIQRITDQLANRNTENEKLITFQESLEDTYKQLADKKESISYHDFTYSLLKDGGVKTKIIKKYLPLINQQVNRFLQIMDFYINFKLDEEFNETIESPIHEDFSYASFSEGEKSRIDLALIFAWREVARFKNSVNTNLMLFDEVFDSSLDSFGTDEFLRIIRYIVKDVNVFVISHKNGMEDKFEKVIRYEKVKGYSRIVS
jgi:DNA repair exonuclease SbcCD ATPase subunit